MRGYYGAYLRYVLYVALFSIALSIAAAAIGGLGYMACAARSISPARRCCATDFWRDRS